MAKVQLHCLCQERSLTRTSKSSQLRATDSAIIASKSRASTFLRVATTTQIRWAIPYLLLTLSEMSRSTTVSAFIRRLIESIVDIANKASLNHLIKDNLLKHHNVNLRTTHKTSTLDEEDYICNRQFCSFCLKTQYEANFIECCLDKSWICPFCQGVCFCTRCLRQDTMTQLKAYFIALGGDLASLLGNSKSIFD